MCLKLCSVLYGSFLSDYNDYLEIHRYEYFAAFAFMQADDRENAVRCARRCLRGVDTIQATNAYYMMGFNPEGNDFKPWSTVLPLSFKILAANRLDYIRSKAFTVLKRYHSDYKPVEAQNEDSTWIMRLIQ